MLPAPLFAAFALMTALAVMAVLWPLSRQRTARLARDADLAVYRDQLSELERDSATGRLSAEQAAAARAEVARRMLAADGRQEVTASGSTSRRRIAAAIALIAIPAIGGGLYLRLGAPDVPDMPLAARLSAPPDGTDVAILVRRVEDHLAANPADGRGYELLAPVYLKLGRTDDAIRAYGEAIRLLGASAEREAALGEALVIRNEGMVSADAARAFQAAVKLDPQMPKARYFLGLAAEQDGRRQDAAAIWGQMVKDAPPGAAWAPMVRAALARMGQGPQPGDAPQPEGARPPAPPPAALAVSPPGPTAGDVAAAAELTDQQRAAMIQSMVEGLETRLSANPKDLDGWLRLARAWKVLGSEAKMRAALDTAQATFAGDDTALARIEAARTELGGGG